VLQSPLMKTDVKTTYHLLLLYTVAKIQSAGEMTKKNAAGFIVYLIYSVGGFRRGKLEVNK